MTYLFDDASPSASPPDTEAVRLGAQRIRELKDRLQTVVSGWLNNDLTWKTSVVPGTALTDQTLTAAKLTNTLFSDGLKKTLNADPVTVNVDGTTITFDASSPKKIQVATLPTSLSASIAPVVGDARNLVVQQASNSTVTVAADEVVLKNSSNVPIIARSVSLTVNIALGVALNGLETGATESASTWYYIWLISDGTNTRAVLEDGSAVLNGGGAGIAPAGPDLSNGAFSGYTYKALVGMCRNDGSSNFISFWQADREVIVAETVIFTGKPGVTGSWTVLGGADLTAAQGVLPPNAKMVFGNMGDTGSATGRGMGLATDGNGAGAQYVVAQTTGGVSMNSFNLVSPYRVGLKTAQTFYYKMATPNSDYRVTVSGFRF